MISFKIKWLVHVKYPLWLVKLLKHIAKIKIQNRYAGNIKKMQHNK